MDEENQVVKPPLTGEQANESAPEPKANEPKAQQAGDKTDPNLLLESLRIEREKRRVLEEEKRIAEEKARQLEDQINSSDTDPTINEAVSDEGKYLKTLIDEQNKKLRQLEEQRELEQVYGQHPELKTLKAEFEAYKEDYPRHKLENVAKLFMAEKGLMEPTRKGLEKTTSGPRSPLQTGMTAEDVRTLRTTNYKKYLEMVQKGQIKIDEKVE